MKKSVLFLTILILSQSVFGQIADAKPDVTIACPSEKADADAKIRLTATMKPDKSENVSYNWMLSNGVILSGQGTKEIEIQLLGNPESVTATIEVYGAYFESIWATCTFQVFKKPMPLKIDELIFSVQGELKARLDSYFNDLVNDPAAQGYIIIYPPSPRNQAYVERIIRDFIKFRKFDPSRVTIVIGEKRDVRPILHFWRIPAGAEYTPDLAGVPEPEPQHSVSANPSACELNGLYQHNLQMELGNNPNATLEIHYLDGKDESVAVNAKRFQLVKQFLEKQFSNPLIFSRAGTAAGNAETRIFLHRPGADKIYYLQIYAIKNKSICFACCDAADQPKNLVVTRKKKSLVKKNK